jgi:transcriptional regulator GlxA family with amidase domain
VDPERYLRMRRLAMARGALRSGDRRWTSVEQVATAHGFPDPAAFGREYLQGFGHVPDLAPVRGTARARHRVTSRHETRPLPVPR